MSILPQLEQDLLQAAKRRLNGASSAPKPRGAAARNTAEHADAPYAGPPASRVLRPDGNVARRKIGARLGGLRLALVVPSTLLATATIALAAGGAILSGSPVRSKAPRNPEVGNGVPAPGGSRLLPLQAADPEGGLPWGMRMVHTTRGEVCLQIGRLQGGQLGELGIDGAFRDDGRFHPMSAAVLPAITRVGAVPQADANTSCQLAGKAVVASQTGVDRSAAETPPRRARSASALRRLEFGILGPQAVSVTYKSGHRQITVPVASGTGAYMIVLPVAHGGQGGYGGASIGTYGDIQPDFGLSAITYRIDGKLCKRGPVHPPWVKTHIPDECPWPHWPKGRATQPDLHKPLHVHLDIKHGLIVGMDVTFVAPLAISDAGHEYGVLMPTVPCHGNEAGVEAFSYAMTGMELDRNVREGATITLHAMDPFQENGCTHRSATVKVVYYSTEGAGSVVVGNATVRVPPGTKPAPGPVIHWRRAHKLLRTLRALAAKRPTR